MTYQKTLAYLFKQLPMFHRIGAAAYKADLSNTIALCKILGNPEKEFKSIHIAGTNGKGSTSHFLASVLQESGNKTGLFTSPHLKDFRERIRINGKMISKRDVTSFVEQHQSDFNNIEPSFFEWTFALAVWYFAKENVDIAVMETGMGGRLDSTNVVKPVVTVITNIGLDHTQFLGTTLNAIAHEKAGIIKPGIPVVIGETHEETELIFDEFAQRLHCKITFADQHILLNKTHFTKHRPPLLAAEYHSVLTSGSYQLLSPLSGKYQLKNLATTLCIIENLVQSGWQIDKKYILQGIRKVVKNTGLMGRWQTISRNPLTIADIGHNPDGINEVLEQIALTPHEKLHFVIGVVNDKDIRTMLSKLPKDASYYFCKADIPRGLDAEELAKLAEAFSIKGKTYTSVREALKAATIASEPNDLVMVGGSAFVVAEVL
ncbi:MAG: folylpolyglutamate synthase/dihydrofolate synthase family protein [Bacteroidales bacterium]|nr:folylpolyglutamate synthase/dihydrofolate synthase family protein [Bacteroidales bacterium]